MLVATNNPEKPVCDIIRGDIVTMKDIYGLKAYRIIVNHLVESAVGWLLYGEYTVVGTGFKTDGCLILKYLKIVSINPC